MSTSVCRECRATIAAVDRFCPACGTPNTTGKLHPRLPPALAEAEPYLDLTVGPDEPGCPRCRRSVRADDPFCRTCGFSLDLGKDPWTEAARALDPDAPPFREGGSVLVWLRWVFRCLIATSAAAAGVSVWLAASVRTLRLRQTSAAYDQVATLSDLRGVVVASLAGIGLLTAVIAVVWLRRALGNAGALGATPTRFRRGWVAPGVLVPAVNVVAVPVLLGELWRGSDPEVPRLDEGRWRERPGPSMAWLGWSILVLFGAIVGVSAAWNAAGDALANDQFAATVDGVAFSVLFAALLVLHIVAHQLAERQELRAHRLDRAVVRSSEEAPATDAEVDLSLHDGATWGRY